jgi:chromosome segregation ATPase
MVRYTRELFQLEAQIAELKQSIAIEEARVGKLHADGEPIEEELKPLKQLEEELRQAEASRDAIRGKKVD